MKTNDFDFTLPDGLIAHYPLPTRDASRMMLIHRTSGEISHAHFTDFSSLIQTGDLVVLNDSRVLPSRFTPSNGGKEVLKISENTDGSWSCLVRPGKSFRIGHPVIIGDSHGEVAHILDDGTRLIKWHNTPPDAGQHGTLALPPYFHRNEEPSDRDRYQTVFADQSGSIAAPTAGLHFTPDLLRTIPHTFLTLHVGIGTFRPVKVEFLADHVMHAEQFTISHQAANAINAAKRVIAVGTTVTRTLEHCARLDSEGSLVPRSGSTSIFLKPGDNFQRVGALLTNLHLPKSTLLMLVSAFAGHELILEAYRRAVEARYRFFSYGDCMLIL